MAWTPMDRVTGRKPKGSVRIIPRILTIFVLATGLALITSSIFAQVPPSIYNQAIADLNHKKYADAEASLKAALNQNPQDARALGLMGVILDARKRYAEAESFYQRALRHSPHSSSLLNNLGNHYLAQRKTQLARAAYLKAVQINPSDQNANFQLAQICVISEQGRGALHYLGQLSREDQATPTVQLLRARALKLNGDSSRAEEQLLEAVKESGGDPQVAFSVGLLFAKWKCDAKAEEAFSQALRSAPGNFDVLYNLGLSALDAHHLRRAEEAFQTALKQHPNDVDCLLGLARIEDERDDDVQAAAILYQAERLAPRQPNVLRFVGAITQKLGLYGDSVIAYDKLLKLQPGDDLARRDRGIALAQAGELTEATIELSSYVRHHPDDPLGLYDLAMAGSLRQKSLAMEHLSEALALDPKMTSARLERALLLRQKGRFDEAVNDLKLVLRSKPSSVPALEELGETYLSAGRAQDALGVLQKASQLAPTDSLVLLRYAGALMRAGEDEKAEDVLARSRNVPANERPQALADATSGFPAVSSSELSGRNVMTLKRLVVADPTDSHLKVELGELLLAEGKTRAALGIFRQVKSSAPNPTELGDCGRALLDAGQFRPAREFLEAALLADPRSTAARLSLAIAVFHDQGAESALAELGKVPLEDRRGNYFLLRAQLLDSLGRSKEAAEALNRGFQASPTRPDLYFQAALFLIKHGRPRQAVDLLAKADEIIPYNPKLWLTRAIAFEMLRRDEQALAVLSQIESRSPGWYLPYEIQGIIQSIRLRPAEAQPFLRMAIALGADNPQVYFYLASTIITANAEDIDASRAANLQAVASAQTAINNALSLDPKDPYIQSLAGKIDYLKKDYQAACRRLNAALAVWPDMIEAHETLSATYRAMGEKDRSIDQLKAILRIKQQSRTADQIPPFPVKRLLFTVQSPIGC